MYGPGQDHANPSCGVIGKFIESLFDGRPPVIHGDGNQTRDFTFVDDAVAATIMAATSDRALGEVFNVGTGVETRVNELAAILIKVTGAQVQPAHSDRRDIDNIRRRGVNIEKARRALRRVPEITLEKGLERTVEWPREKNRRGGAGGRVVRSALVAPGPGGSGTAWPSTRASASRRATRAAS